MPSDIIIKKEGKCYWIIFNRPTRKNAIHIGMYDSILNALDESEKDPGIMLTIFTGVGEFYSSGNDFSMEALSKLSDDPALGGVYAKLVEKLIDHSKLLIALVNGPAIGIACTTLAIFDLVLTSEKAYFYTPFTSLGLTPEGCSSVLFSEIMGYTKAAQLLLFSDKMSANEAYINGFVSEVYKDNEFKIKCEERIRKYENALSMDSILISKSMMRSKIPKEKLKKINNWEKEMLSKQLEKEECQEFLIKKFFKSKV
uniref:Enoyl-CoA delta isomerase 2, mitochondrial n=1 Tax=Parastrongyloides trichosuri TaxID=131310 RepID=A0A0N4ZV93_PARTI